MTGVGVDEVSAAMAAAAQGGAAAGWAALDALLVRLYDRRLFTGLNHLEANGEVERLYSSNTAAYPVGGRKKKQDTHWGKKTLDEGALYICHGRADIERTFFDHALIFSLGVGGMVNVPVMFGGRCLASLSISTAGDRFSEADEPTLSIIAGLALPLVLSAR